jgi:hypothetical protein
MVLSGLNWHWIGSNGNFVNTVIKPQVTSQRELVAELHICC